MWQDNVLIHHDDCDGFGCAYAFWNIFGNTMKYIPMHHGEPKENFDFSILEGKNVYIADFAFSLEGTMKILEIANNLVMIDHHVTARNELESIADMFEYIYDEKRAACTLCWEYLFAVDRNLSPKNKTVWAREVPELLLYIEDRDIFKWEMPDAEEVLLYLDSYDFDFGEWIDIEKELSTRAGLDRAILVGKSIRRYRDMLIDRLMRENVHFMQIKGYFVKTINVPFYKTEMVSKLAQDEPFAAGYHYNGKEYCFSLRSSEDGIDVAKIAEMFEGGGGHKHAAGFSVKDLKELC